MEALMIRCERKLPVPSRKEENHAIASIPGMSAAGWVGAHPAPQQGRETVSRQAHNLEFRVRPPALQCRETGHIRSAVRRDGVAPRRRGVRGPGLVICSASSVESRGPDSRGGRGIRLPGLRSKHATRTGEVRQPAWGASQAADDPVRYREGRDSGAELHRRIEPDRTAPVYPGCSRALSRRAKPSPARHP